MKKCRECHHDVSENAKTCPNCSTPYPAKEKWKDWGYEYKSKITILGIPLLHISFKYRQNGIPVPAKGIISIGQFGIGLINISQFGIGIFSISQFTIAVYAVAQIALAYSLIAQIGLYVDQGYGQIVRKITEVGNKPGIENLKTTDYTPLQVDDQEVSMPADSGLNQEHAEVIDFEPARQYAYQPPDNINDGFDVGTLAEVNSDSTLIVKAVNEIRHGNYKEVHSLLIFKDNNLVLEEYFWGHKYKWDGVNHHGKLAKWDRDMLHSNMSVSKSITSTGIGIAIDNGFIESVHQSIFDYLPGHQNLNTAGKDKITIEHLLTMTSGLEWDEWSAPLSSAKNDIVGIWYQNEDPITFILERPLVNEPGTSFTYSGGNMIVLGEIIRNATGMKMDEFTGKYLFEPLQIDSSTWRQFENGVIEAGGGIKITSRDMLKIGVTFLNKGVWNGKRIISEQWVEKSATPFPENNRINLPEVDSGLNGYSYSWWTDRFSISGTWLTRLFSNPDEKINMFWAGGWGGQEIMVFPGLNTVVVFTGGNYVSKRPPFRILKKYVIPAINHTMQNK
ncbi:MAG: serine hydrolase [Candidatus Electryonea clarkiae]|nr:serine hydrolase [Candidatus Electryonea clarkiae]MDP8285994.1 serine hydrolase [Candidatus Electryonea clarkiae]